MSFADREESFKKANLKSIFVQIEYPETEHVDDSIIVHSAFRHLDADRRALKPLRFATMLKLLIRNSTVDQEIPPSHS